MIDGTLVEAKHTKSVSVISVNTALSLAHALLLAVTFAACGGEATEPPPAVAHVRGSVATLGGRSLEGLTATATWPNTSAAADVLPDGQFEIALTALPSGTGALTIHSSESGALNGPAWLPLGVGELPQSIRIVVVPTSWTLTSGTHSGQAVAIRPVDAADSRVLPSYWGFAFPFEQEGRTQAIVDSTRWTGGLTTWPAAALPVSVALDRPRSTSALSAADSMALWEHLSHLEDVLGRDAFHPATLEDLTLEDRGGEMIAPGAVLVRIDDGLDLRGRGLAVVSAASWLRSEEVSSWSGGRVSHMAVVSGDIEAGLVRFRETAGLSDRGLVIHEAMHVLGVGHGCSWTSIQTYCTSLELDAPSAEDVAHLEVLEEMRRSEIDLDTTWGILSAVFGARVAAGLAPIPAAQVVEPNVISRR